MSTISLATGIGGTSDVAANRIDEIESVRGVAAFLVFLYHIPLWNPVLHGIPFIRHSHVMVELFFVMSGFVIWRAYGTRLHSVRQVLRFQWLRFGRLYPVHLTFLLVYLAIEIAKYVLTRRLGVESPNTVAFGQNNPQAFVEQLFLVQALGFTNNASTFNFPAWSISTEFYTYTLFALIVLTLARWQVAIFTIISAGAIALLVFVDDRLGTFDFILKCFGGFFIGCLLARWLERPDQQRLARSAWMLPAVVVAIALFLWFKPPDRRFDLLIFPLTALLLIALVQGRHGPMRGLLSSRPLMMLGAMSYSLYMAHASMIWSVSQFFRFVLKRPEATMSNGQSAPSLSLLEALAAYAFVIVLTLTVGWLVYRFIENPWRLRSRRSRLFTASEPAAIRPAATLDSPVGRPESP